MLLRKGRRPSGGRHTDPAAQYVVAALLLVVGRISKTFLYGVAPLGFSKLGSATIVLVISSALAAEVPARLASSLDQLSSCARVKVIGRTGGMARCVRSSETWHKPTYGE